MPFKKSVMSLLFAFVAVSCFKPSTVKETERRAKALSKQADMSADYVLTDDVKLHYVSRGDGRRLIVFVHGTPGSWTIFSPQLDNLLLVESARVIAIDRPGWGQSKLLTKTYDDSLAAQSRVLGSALTKIRARYDATELVLVGHSLGASLVPRIAMDYPELADAVISIAGDLTHKYPATHWYNGLADWSIVRWMVPYEMQRANDEVLSIGSGLLAMQPLWQGLGVPFLVVQGENDGLVNPKHAMFAEKLSTRNYVKVVRFKGAGHLVHVSHDDKVNRLILDVLNRNENEFFLSPAMSDKRN